nr:MAG TPA: hypothetical protein [Caudoviricetes sp.]
MGRGVIPACVFGTYGPYPHVYPEGNGVIGWVKSHCILLTYDPSPFYT